MDMIAVDPKLFITCRLCLEEMGQYQIVPTVQEQIKYCFDIDVQPFDGLPQLICVKCKDILGQYSSTKKEFIEKQSNLKNKLLTNKESGIRVNPEPQQDTVSSTQSKQASSNLDNKPSVSQYKRTIQSSAASDSDTDSVLRVTKSKKKEDKNVSSKKFVVWDSEYKKHYMCRLCSSQRSSLRSLKNHYWSHKKIRNKYGHIINRSCSVYLQKLDNIPNITGLSDMVVHSESKIIQSSDIYYILYSKDTNISCNTDVSKDNVKKITSNSICSDSTDGENIAIKHTKQNRRRLLSKSSNDTVVIETENNKMVSDEEFRSTQSEGEKCETNIEQCINIDDTSGSESEDQSKVDSSLNVTPKKPIGPTLDDYKTIQGIISACVNNYRKKKDNLPQRLESKLKHIILSIGRKVINNKQGIQCVGLLRYMDHKNLAIQWVPKTSFYNPNNTANDCIRLTTKLKLSSQSDSGWIHVEGSVKCNTFSNTTGNNCIFGHETPSPNLQNIATPGLSINSKEIFKEIPGVKDTAVFYADTSCSDTKNKLLNANPVANPKQLPRKSGQSNESRSNKTLPLGIPCVNDNMESNKASIAICENTPFRNVDDNDTLMPIITSTTSLAEVASKEDSQKVAKSNNSAPEASVKNAPRIKVKPVSELMPQQGQNHLIKEQVSGVSNNLITEAQVPFSQGNALGFIMPTIVSYVEPNSSSVQIVQVPCLNVMSTYQPVPCSSTTNTVAINSSTTNTVVINSSTTNTFATDSSRTNTVTTNAVAIDSSTMSTVTNDISNPDYLILDSVELPNTKTNSPLQYFKSLLHIHNIILLHPNDTLSQQFVCLIKFKVVFKQEAKDQPVVLCLSLFCSGNTFCLKVRDVDVYKISVNWQWEILQIFAGEVATKILANAQKVNQATYDSTKKILTLLKSINVKKEL